MNVPAKPQNKVLENLSVVLLIMMAGLVTFGFSNASWANLNLLRSQQRLQLSQLDLISIAPDNLASAAESLRVNIPSQKKDFPVDELTRLPAWSELEKKLTAYTGRLKLVQAQAEELDDRIQQRVLLNGQISLVGAYAVLAVMLVNLALMVRDKRRLKLEAAA